MNCWTASNWHNQRRPDVEFRLRSAMISGYMTMPSPNLRLLTVLLSGMLASTMVLAQSSERWFQIEVSIFTNEDPVDRESEYWRPDTAPLSYPGTMQRLQSLMDLLIIDDLLIADAPVAEPANLTLANTPPVTTVTESILATGPFPADSSNEFRFYDFARDALVELPASAGKFLQTNQAIESSPAHRLLYHTLWRQPVSASTNSIPLYISGGQQFGGTSELNGSLTLRFNAIADRVNVDADLWLSEFSILGDDSMNWELPAVPTRVQRNYEQYNDDNGLDFRINRIYKLKQSRDMRSTEFHYLDHPAFGVVIAVDSYTVPPPALVDTETAAQQ